MTADKTVLRRRILAARAHRDAADLDRADEELKSTALAWLAGEHVSRLAAYLSIGSEPPTRRLVDNLAAAGVEVLLPVIDGDRLDWAGYAGPAALARRAFGLDEPTTPLVEGALATCAVVLVPALAVSRGGARLGRGGGYYDRALAGCRAPAFAVVFDDEVLDALPVEPHDATVTGWLTPREVGRAG